mgnify:CR=1 FL=1
MWGLALFLATSALPRHVERLEAMGQRLLAAGQQLVAVRVRLHTLGSHVPPTDLQFLLDRYKRFVVLMEPLEVATPKFHLMFHLILRSRVQGPPRLYQCFLDESLNRTLKLTLRCCHQLTFETTALVRLTEILERPALRRRLV